MAYSYVAPTGPGADNPEDAAVVRAMQVRIDAEKKKGALQATITEAEMAALKRINVSHVPQATILGLPVVVQG